MNAMSNKGKDNKEKSLFSALSESGFWVAIVVLIITILAGSFWLL